PRRPSSASGYGIPDPQPRPYTTAPGPRRPNSLQANLPPAGSRPGDFYGGGNGYDDGGYNNGPPGPGGYGSPLQQGIRPHSPYGQTSPPQNMRPPPSPGRSPQVHGQNPGGRIPPVDIGFVAPLDLPKPKPPGGAG